MALKIKPRATVTEAFIEFYMETADSRLQAIKEDLSGYRPAQREQMARRYEHVIRKLGPLAEGKTGPQIGIDLEISRFRAMDFDRFDVERVDGLFFLMGYTRPVKMTKLGSPSEWWDIGPFRIAVPVSGIRVADISRIHLIPQRAPDTHYRHPHHTSGRSHDLSAAPGWCWSSFAEPVLTTLKELDLVEFFRLLYIFLQRYYAGSPLLRPSSMPHAWYHGVEGGSSRGRD